ncbi:MAG: outer membrane protein assembly factor BamD, partial [Rhodospirillales bacterium]
MSFLRLLLAISLGLFLFACSGQKPEKYEERSVDSIYNEAMDSVLAGNYLTAAKQFFEVERQHPYSAWAAKAQIMGAYSYFRLDQYDDSINAADRFIQLHPSNADAPYAYYLRSLAYYEQIVDVARDQSLTQQALQALEDVIRRYPDTKYARDAALKLDLTRDHLAGKEMSVGRFYLEKGELAAAINRFKTVVEQYQTTSHVPEALLRMAECYSALGVKTEAKRVVAILGHNFPGSTWYTDAYNLLATLDSESGGATDERPFY